MKKIIVIDNSELFLLGIVSLLDTEYIIKHGKSSNELFKILEKDNFCPDLIFINNKLNDKKSLSGLETIQILKKKFENIPIAIITGSDSIDLLRESIEIGVNGFLLKGSLKKEIYECINSLISGNNYLSKDIPFEYLRTAFKKKERKFDILSPSEKKIFILLSKSYTNKHISEILFISIHTVETHKYNLKTKLGIKTDIEILTLGIKEKIPEILECIGI